MVATVDENTPRLSIDAAQLLADLPPRVARMETHIEYMRLDIAELKAGQKDLRTELKSEIGELRGEIKEVRAVMRADFLTLLRLMIGGFGALATLMIAGFGSLLGVMATSIHLIG
jgi:hypothetical protein